MKTHSLSGKSIIIAGAGVSGLAFAIALRKQWSDHLGPPPRIRIFERDTEEAPPDREGYSLSLAGQDGTGGLYALKQLGLLDEILQYAILGTGDEGRFKLWDGLWGEIMSVRLKPAKGLPTSGIRIRRQDLKRVLVKAVGLGVVEWGASCVEARSLGENMLVRVERDGTAREEACDLLISADGANSKLRSCLRPDDVLEYAGAIQFGGSASFDVIPPPLADNWGLMVSGEGHSCFFSPVDDHSVIWSLSHLSTEPEPPLEKTSLEQVEGFLDDCHRATSSLGGVLLEQVIAATDTAKIFRLNARDKKAFKHDFKEGAVVYIGDSNHAVSPFAGYGASLALKDGWDLAEQICKGDTLREAVQRYDDVSVPRAMSVLKTSRERIRRAHSTGWAFWFFRWGMAVLGFLLWMTGQA